MTTPNLARVVEELRASCKEATQGEWIFARTDTGTFRVATVELFGIYSRHAEHGDAECGAPEADARHMALCSPANVALLLDALEQAQKDAERLDYVLREGAFIVWSMRDGSIRQCQLMTQDEDEEYHWPAGERKFFNTEREAIDAAITKGPAA